MNFEAYNLIEGWIKDKEDNIKRLQQQLIALRIKKIQMDEELALEAEVLQNGAKVIDCVDVEDPDAPNN